MFKLERLEIVQLDWKPFQIILNHSELLLKGQPLILSATNQLRSILELGPFNTTTCNGLNATRSVPPCSEMERFLFTDPDHTPLTLHLNLPHIITNPTSITPPYHHLHLCNTNSFIKSFQMDFIECKLLIFYYLNLTHTIGI